MVSRSVPAEVANRAPIREMLDRTDPAYSLHEPILEGNG